MPTISAFKKAYDVQPNTIRQWSRTFADFLEPGANPPNGKTRTYSDDDARVIALVAAMRQDNRPYEAIRAALAAGDRGQWPIESDQTAQDAPGRDENTFALVTQLTARAASLEGELGATKQERDYLRDQLQQAQTTAQDAQIRATIAETKLEALAIMGDMDKRRGSAWDRLRAWVMGEGE